MFFSSLRAVRLTEKKANKTKFKIVLGLNLTKKFAYTVIMMWMARALLRFL